MRILITLMALTAAVKVAGQEPPNEIVRKALIRDAQDLNGFQTLIYTKAAKTEKLDKNGQPLPGNGKDESDEDKDRIDITLQKIFRSGRYIYTDKGLVQAYGRTYIILFFQPNSSKFQPGPEFKPGMGFRGRIIEEGLNKVINHLNGYLYIDQETYGIVKIVAWLPQTVTIRGVFVFKQLNLDYDQEYLFGVWAPKKIVTTVKYAEWLFFGEKFKRSTIEFHNYKPRPPAP